MVLNFAIGCLLFCLSKFDIIRAEQRVSSNLIGRAISYMPLYSPLRATKLATFAISAGKRAGQLLNQTFVYSKDITPSPGYIWKDGEYSK